MAANLIQKNINLGPEEAIIKISRAAGRTLILGLGLPLIVIVIDFFFLYPLFYRGQAGIIIFFSLLAISSVWLLHRLLRWRLTLLIITNQRLVDIDHSKLLTKTVSAVALNEIAEVVYQTEGLGQMINRLGNLYVSLVDSRTKILVRNLAAPQKIQQLILQLKAQLRPPDGNNLLGSVNKIKSHLDQPSQSDHR